MNYADIHDSLTRLKFQNEDLLAERYRIRSILDGGAEGIYSVLAWNVGKGASMGGDIAQVTEQYGVDLPAVNMMDSGLTRLAQKVGRVPTLKPPKADGESVIDSHQKRIDLLREWDRQGKVSRQYPQAGRWLPGYGFVFHRLVQRRGKDKKLFPVMELRDPYDVYVGWLGPDQQPKEYATVRRIPITELVHQFDDPEEAAKIARILQTKNDPWSFLSSSGRSWEGIKEGVEIVEYETAEFRCVCIPEAEAMVSFTPNPISVPTFSFGKRTTFNKPASQYNQIIGIMAMQAKLNILLIMALEDGVMVETNIEGEVESGAYEMGRDAVNILAPGTKVTKPYPVSQAQTIQGINHLERQLRIGAQYDVQQDGQSPNSFATGMGMRELQGAVNDNVREYHDVLADVAEVNDDIRQTFAAEMYASEKRSYYDMKGKKQTASISSVLTDDYRTRRIYGAMATFDDNQKIIVGMQLETGGYIDTLTFQENIDGLHDLELVNERITRKRARETLYELLRAESVENPAAKAALVEVMLKPGDEDEILKKYFGAPEVDPQEAAAQQAAMMAQQQAATTGGPVGIDQGHPPSIQSVLSRIEGSGGIDGAVQSVATQ